MLHRISLAARLVAGMAILGASATLQADGMSLPNQAWLEVADSDVLGYYLHVDPECALSQQAVEGIVYGVLTGRGLQPMLDSYSDEGLNLDLSLSCMKSDEIGHALFSFDGAFSLVQPDESDLLINNTYGSYGSGDRQFIATTIMDVVQQAINDFDAANARHKTPEPLDRAPVERAVPAASRSI